MLTGNAPTTSELSTIVLPTKVRLILEVFTVGTNSVPFTKTEVVGDNLIVNGARSKYLKHE